MSLLQNRNNNDEIIKGRFVRRVLTEASAELDKVQSRYMSSRGFGDNGWNDRTFNVTDNSLEYQHLKKHRFVDMRTRNGKEGKKPKKSHAIHNKPIFGQYNNIIRNLAFGFTEEVKEQLRTLED